MSGKMKYKVGDEFPNHKRLTKYIGSHPKFRTSLWMWECTNCGKESGPSLTNSITRTKKPACCFQSLSGGYAANWKGSKDIPLEYFNRAKYGALKRNYSFNITIEDMQEQWEYQHGRCMYMGIPLSFGKGKKGTASLDRKDNSVGYEKDNIQWVHKHVNRAKSDLGYMDFIAMCLGVSNFFRSGKDFSDLGWDVDPQCWPHWTCYSKDGVKTLDHQPQPRL